MNEETNPGDELTDTRYTYADVDAALKNLRPSDPPRDSDKSGASTFTDVGEFSYAEVNAALQPHPDHV